METGNKISGSINRISIKIIKLISLSIIIIMLAGSTNNVSGDIVWFEKFDNGLVGLQLYGWNSTETGFNQDINHGFTIVDGALKAPSSDAFATQSNLDIDSSVANGTWSFDLNINDTSETHFGFAFMFTAITGDYNRSGKSAVPDDFSGYGLVIVTTERNDNLVGPGINLAALDPAFYGSNQIIMKYPIPRSNLTGIHNYGITRNLMGEFNVYFDFELQFSVTDTRTNSSEKVRVTSWMGGASIDNIRVSDTIDEFNVPTSAPSSPDVASITSSSQTSSDKSEENDSPIPVGIWISPLLVIVIIRRIQTPKYK